MENNIIEDYPVKFEVNYPERSSRLLAFLSILLFFPKVIALIPHLIVLYFLDFASLIATWFSFWVILFTGKYPKPFFDFIVGVMRWKNRVHSWMCSLTDKYPPFKLN